MDKRTKILIGVAITVLVTGAGLGAFFLFRQHKVNNPLDAAENTPKLGMNTDSSSSTATQSDTDTDAQKAYDIANYGTTGQVPSTWSQVETNYGDQYNYQKRDGIWWTAKKSNPTYWVSLADPKYASSVAKLNARYPND